MYLRSRAKTLQNRKTSFTLSQYSKIIYIFEEIANKSTKNNSHGEKDLYTEYYTEKQGNPSPQIF